MLFPIQRLLEGRDPPVCISIQATVREAMASMVQNDFSQLPVLDRRSLLAGLISQETIARRYFHLNGAVPILDLTVDHCLVPAVTLSPEHDLLEALDRLKDVYAVIIARDQQPVGILTDYDTTHFFRDLTEDLILVQDIEITLRNYIEEAFPEEAARDEALSAAFGKDKGKQDTPARQHDHLTFQEHIQLIVADPNWHSFSRVLEPKELFQQLMEQVRQIRNQLAHFRGRTDAVQHDVLMHARAWLEARPGLGLRQAAKVAHVVREDALSYDPSRAGRYEALQAWLEAHAKRGSKRIRVSFHDMDHLLGDGLPRSAREHRSWWANESSTHSQARAWLNAGWVVDEVDLGREDVEFRYTTLALMESFFFDVLRRVKAARPGVTRAERTFLQNWWGFSAGRTGFSVNWVFDSSNRLRVELYIDTGDRTRNKAAFDHLRGQRHEIEEEAGLKMTWDRLDDKIASRLYVSIPATISDPASKLEKAKTWAVETALKFVDVFQKRIAQL